MLMSVYVQRPDENVSEANVASFAQWSTSLPLHVLLFNWL